MQSINARRLVAKRNIGQKGPDDDRSQATVEDRAGRE